MEAGSMGSTRLYPGARSGESGFSLVELLIVVVIIVILAAVMAPNIMGYLKLYHIKGATQQVAGEINVARSKAIMKNVNLGVVFAVLNNTQYQWVIEDDQLPGTAPNWFAVGGEDWTVLTGLVPPQKGASQAGPIQNLPLNVTFDSPTNCGLAAVPDTWGVRLTQIGGMCAFGGANCGAAPPNAVIPTNYVRVLGGAATVCLWENSTGLRKTVAVTTGGRVIVQP